MNSSSPLPELTPSPPPTYAELQLSDIPSHSPRPRRSAARQSALKTLLHLDAGPMHPPEKLAGQAPNNHSLKRPLRTESPPFADSIGQQWAIQAPSPSPPSAPTPTFASTLQTIVCMRLSDPSITRCTHCITRQTGDSCRFRNLRWLGETSRFEDPSPSEELEFRTEFNQQPSQAQINILRRAVAEAIHGQLKEELERINGLPNILTRHREIGFRATCDMCSTSIFHQTLLCRHCGREACLDCAKSISSIDEAVLPSLKRQRSNTGQPRSTDTKHNLMLIKCQPQTFHRIDDFIPTTRFDKSILQRVVNEMGSLRESSLRDVAVRRLDVSDSIDSGFAELPAHKLPIHVSGNGEDPQMAFWTPLSIQSSELTEEVFKILWQKHEPLVVRDVYVGQTWSPTELSEKYGSMACTVVDCHSEGTMQKMTVETFFARFGRYENRKRSWKLKDWPPSDEFKNVFPDLYEEFHQILPMRQYTGRDGVLNLAAHFPLNAVAPDVGPKMYNAFAMDDVPGASGSTRLHMDIADAVNVMVHSELTPKGDPGFATWDLFRAEDAGKIREFLFEEFPLHSESPHLDPIHSQHYYLDSVLLDKLRSSKGVKSFRIEQHPGEAVFIPAGCPHQVLNRADCVKVAIDFVSPENLAYCRKLTQEFRDLNYEKCWKDDVLQLQTMMWYTWLSCDRFKQGI